MSNAEGPHEVGIGAPANAASRRRDNVSLASDSPRQPHEQRRGAPRSGDRSARECGQPPTRQCLTRFGLTEAAA